MTGNFEGIGAEMALKDGILTIVSPLEGTPAERSGLLAGDKILKIDNETTANIDIRRSSASYSWSQGNERYVEHISRR
jgi:carboxyl-terminal processing protease